MATVESAPSRRSGLQPAVKAARWTGVDAFRGLTMICMLGEGFGLLHYQSNQWIAPIAAQFTHTEWNMTIPRDLHFWDLIQPFFMFIVGVVMPLSFARRWERGETWSQSLWHVLRRSALLIALGLLARSVQHRRPVLDLINVLAQIAFTYLVAFLLLRQPWKVQLGAALALLAGHWALYEFARAPGVLGPWIRDANIGWYIDTLIPHLTRDAPYATINCISSAANTIFGVLVGELLLSRLPEARKMRILAACGVAAIAAGLALSTVIPLNKKIWTASFAIYSTGATLLVLLAFYYLLDVKAVSKKWAVLFLAVGANSIFIYMFHETLHGFIFPVVHRVLPEVWALLAVLALEIAICLELYRRRIFLRV